MNGKILTGSICFSDLMMLAKKGHTAFSRAKNGKVYVAITQFLNDEPDQYGNDSSIMLNSKKESKEIEGKVYVGNAKFLEKRQPKPEPSRYSSPLDDDGFPF